MLPNATEYSIYNSSLLRQCEQMHQVPIADAVLPTSGLHFVRAALASTARTDLV